VSSANPFAASYTNPLAAGLSGVTGRSTFGTALYANLNPTGTMSGSSGGGSFTGSRTGTTGMMMGGGAGFMGSGAGGAYGASARPSSGSYPGLGGTSTTTTRAPTYSAAIGFSAAPVAPSGLQTSLQQMLARSNALPSSPNIQVAVDGDTVVLRGLVADDHDRRLAEGMVRLTPGVHDVRNELVVATAAAPQVPAANGQAAKQP
jgi:hypothetical protein